MGIKAFYNKNIGKKNNKKPRILKVVKFNGNKLKWQQICSAL